MSLTSYQAAPPRSPFHKLEFKIYDVRSNARRNLRARMIYAATLQAFLFPFRLILELILLLILAPAELLQFVKARALGAVVEAAF